ncbi:hypothetical protein MAR_010443, partial [Mya arenaria]
MKALLKETTGVTIVYSRDCNLVCHRDGETCAVTTPDGLHAVGIKVRLKRLGLEALEQEYEDVLMRLTCVQFRGVMLLVYTVYLTPTSADLGSQDIDPLMLESHSSLSPLRNTLSSLNDYLVEYQKRSCQFGLNSHHCALSALDDMKGASEWLSSAHSPGKRSQEPTDTQDKLLDDVVNKRAHLATLQALLDTAEEQMNAKREAIEGAQTPSCLLTLIFVSARGSQGVPEHVQEGDRRGGSRCRKFRHGGTESPYNDASYPRSIVHDTGVVVRRVPEVVEYVLLVARVEVAHGRRVQVLEVHLDVHVPVHPLHLVHEAKGVAQLVQHCPHLQQKTLNRSGI